MKKIVGILDYESGNLHNIRKALVHLGWDCLTLKNSEGFDSISYLVLPGMGSFDTAMRSIHSHRMTESILTWLKEDRPTLAICLGMQILFEASEEGSEKGLGFLRGKSVKLSPSPHIGWAKTSDEKKYFFAHSYGVDPENRMIITSTCRWEKTVFTAVLKLGQLLACQFHPEISGPDGMSFLKGMGNL